MKYRVTSSVPARTKTDFVASIESLTQSLDDLYTAYDAVVAAEGRVLEAEECLHDCHEALESIKKFGVNEINMSILNKDNILNDAVGLESIALEAITKLTDAEKKLLQSKYTSSLEALEGDSKKSFIAKVKGAIAKIIAWIKEWFISDAKILAVLKECKFEGELDTEKKITALKYEDATKLKTTLEGLVQKVSNWTLKGLEENEELSGNAFSTDLLEVNNDNGTAKDLGWSTANAKTMRDSLLSEVKSRTTFKTFVDAAQKKITAQISGNDDTGALSKGKELFVQYMRRVRLLNAYKRAFNRLAMSVIAVDKVCKPAEAK